MAEIVRMPKLSDTMTEGTVAAWHKKVGDKVKSGELLAEIETDKATMEFESYVDGILLYIGVEKGKTVAVDSLLAVFGKEGEDVSAIVAAEGAAPAAKVEAPVAAAPAPSAPAPVAALKANDFSERKGSLPIIKKDKQSSCSCADAGFALQEHQGGLRCHKTLKKGESGCSAASCEKFSYSYICKSNSQSIAIK